MTTTKYNPCRVTSAVYEYMVKKNCQIACHESEDIRDIIAKKFKESSSKQHRKEQLEALKIGLKNKYIFVPYGWKKWKYIIRTAAHDYEIVRTYEKIPGMLFWISGSERRAVEQQLICCRLLCLSCLAEDKVEYLDDNKTCPSCGKVTS